MVDKSDVTNKWRDATRDKASCEEASRNDIRHIMNRCFFWQQCAEKALKAALASEGYPYRKSHDLDYLKDALKGNWCINYADLSRFSNLAVAARYTR